MFIFFRLKSVQKTAELLDNAQIIFAIGRPDSVKIKMTGSSELDILGCLFLCYFHFGQAKESKKILNSAYIII